MYLRVKFLYLELSVQCDIKNSADSNDVFTFSLNQILRKLQQFYWRRIPENGSNLNCYISILKLYCRFNTMPKAFYLATLGIYVQYQK